jgi:hypothetical protein
VEEVPLPVPAERQLLAREQAAGVCISILKLAAHATIQSEDGIPVATGENTHTVYKFRHPIEAGGVSFVEPDVSNCGGVTEWMGAGELPGQGVVFDWQKLEEQNGGGHPGLTARRSVGRGRLSGAPLLRRCRSQSSGVCTAGPIPRKVESP